MSPKPLIGTTPPPRVSPDIARSWLLVSAARPQHFDEAAESRADQIVLDLEDAVDPSLKASARDFVVHWLHQRGEAWVRINDRTSEFWSDDVDALAHAPGLLGVVLAKTESAEHVSETFSRVNAPVVALVESALGIEESTTIARAKGAFRLAFGSGDYRRDTGTSADPLAMAYPRSRLVVASRVGGLPGPIDGPTVGNGHPVLREQGGLAVALGMTGKLCLDRGQLAIINEVISPTPSDVAWARAFLADHENRGGTIRDGSDPPRLGRATKIDQLARAFGVEPA